MRCQELQLPLCCGAFCPLLDWRTYLFVQNEIVSVAVMFLERELRNVVPLDLLNRLLQPVERRINRFRLLRVVKPLSIRDSRWSRTSAP